MFIIGLNIIMAATNDLPAAFLVLILDSDFYAVSYFCFQHGLNYLHAWTDKIHVLLFFTLDHYNLARTFCYYNSHLGFGYSLELFNI